MSVLVVRPEARLDLLSARGWYDRQRSGLGDRFADAAEEMLDRIRDTPLLYAEFEHGVRRAKLKKFPYIVYYRVLADHVEILAVLYGSRHERAWQERL